MLDAVMGVLSSTSFCKYEHIPPEHEYSPCRDEDMIVWKKAYAPIGYYDAIGSFYVVVKLKIPKDAAVVFTPSKCRADRAEVLGFYSCEFRGGEISQLNIPYATSLYDLSFRYKFDEEVMPDCFDRDLFRTCSNGIHFFRTFEEARTYII